MTGKHMQQVKGTDFSNLDISMLIVSTFTWQKIKNMLYTLYVM